MTLRASFIWKNPDSTSNLNERLERVVNRGVIFGGNVVPGIGLNVVVDPSVAISFDGMTVVEDAPQTLPVLANEKNYIVLWAKYNAGGSPATPTLEWHSYKEADYLVHAQKDYLIVYCVADIPPAAVSVTPNDLYFDYRDEINPLGRDWYRGTAATPAALPVPPPHINRVGDFYFVLSDRTFHFWTGTAWSPLNTGSYNTETTLMNHMLVESQHERNVEGSGVVAGPRPNSAGNYASDTEILIVETPTVADQIGFDSFTADVNGHRVELHGQYVTMDPKPGIGERYDIIFLEVWREYIDPSAAVPEDIRYDRNPDGTLKYTISEVDEKLQKLEWQQGIPTAPPADNFNLNPIDADDHGWNVLRYRLGTASNLTATTLALYNPGHANVASDCTNIDGNPFTGQPAGSTADDRIWVAPAAVSSVDGYSWAIPLFVVKRTSLEVIPNAIQVFRDGVRFVFPVYPVADVSHSARKAIDSVYLKEETPFGVNHYPYDEPSGFLTGMDHVMQTGAFPTNLVVYDEQVKVRVRGIEDWLEFPCGPQLTMPSAPTAVNGWARNLVYLKMNITLYDNADGTANSEYLVSRRHRPYIPSNSSGTIRGQGWKRGYVQWQLVAEDLGNNDYLDEADAMVAAGWTRGDVTMAGSGAQYEDGGIWSKSIAIDADDRIHPFLAEWAIPIAVIHRKNTQPWAFDTNPNGSGAGRPDGLTDPDRVYPDDLVDLRHEVGIEEHELEERLKRDIDRMMKGQLRTRLANKHLGAGGTTGEVAGARILQADALGAVGGAAQLSAPDGVRKIWSDAREFYPVSIEFDILASSSGDLYNYNHAGTQGTLQIRAPGFPTAYAQIVRHTPAMLYTGADEGSIAYLKFYGPPCWTTQQERLLTTGNPVHPSPAAAKWIDSSGTPPVVVPPVPAGTEDEISFYYYPDITRPYTGGQGFDVTVTDAKGRAIEMTGEIDTTGITSGTAVLTWWVHFDRSFTGSNYSANYGLSGIPDTVHKVVKDPGGTDEELHVGPMYTTVRKPIVGTSITITDADVTAASGISGTVTLMGVDRLSAVAEDPTVLLGPATVTMNDARDTIVVDFGAGVFTGSVDMPVFFSTSDMNKWVEVGRGGKSVQAYFEWEELDIDHTVPAPSGDFSYSIGGATWRNVSVGGNTTSEAMPICWTRAALGADWNLVRNVPIGVLPETTEAGHEHSNLVSYKSDDFSQYALVIVPAHKALSTAASDRCVIHYTYTPYQGLSSDGEQQATIGTALPKCKELLHGKVEANSDFYVSQSGACSYFSGVDSWTGIPANHVGLGAASALLGSARFEMYNETIVVKGIQGGGTTDLTSRVLANHTCNAASMLRMPFPINTSMFASAYHTGAMNFDFDPARAGVASGYRCYAPGYEPVAPPSVPVPRIDQFVNSLTPLCTVGAPAQQEEGAVITPFMYTAGPYTTGELTTSRWETSGAAQQLDLYIDPRVKGSQVVKRLAVYADIDEFLTLWFTTLWENNGKQLPISGGSTLPSKYLTPVGSADPKWTSLQDLTLAGARRDVYYTVNPGSIIEWYLANSDNANRVNTATLVSYVQPAANDGYIYGSYAAIDTEEVYNKNTGTEAEFHVGRVTDIVTIPFGSSAHRRLLTWATGAVFFPEPATLEDSQSIGVTSLKGLQIEYPAWSPATIATLEGLLTATSDSRNAGRGIYLSGVGGASISYRYNMPVLVPGTGTPLADVCKDAHLLLDNNDLTPGAYPYMPGEPLFSDSGRVYYSSDHGGPMAYVCFGLLVNPTADTYKNQLVIQMSGGPTGGVGAASGAYTQDDLDGTAIDAFWPKGRPLLKSKK